MELDQAIQERRSIRKYTEVPVQKEIIQQIIEAGIWAPSACNIQGWKFIVIDEAQLLRRIAQMGAASFLTSAHQAILVLYDNQTDNLEYHDYIQSAAACIQNMLLKAHSLKVGTCWVNNLPNKKTLRRLLAIPKHYSPIALITLGYYDQEINDRPRKYTVDEATSYNRFNCIQSNKKNTVLLSARRIARRIYHILPCKKYFLKIVDRIEKKFDN